MTRGEDVGERDERRHERVVLGHGQDDERAAGLGDPDGLALPAVDALRTQNLPRSQNVGSPSRQNSQVPSDHRKGATTTSPARTVAALAPTSSTTPTNSWPIRVPAEPGSMLR